MEPEKKQNNNKQMVIVSLSIGLISILASAGIWFLSNQKLKKENSLHNEQILILRGQLDLGLIKKFGGSEEREDVNVSQSKVYTNSANKFQITFTDNWKDYKVEKYISETNEIGIYDVVLKDQSGQKISLFRIYIETPEQYKNNNKILEEGINIIKITELNGKVYSYSKIVPVAVPLELRSQYDDIQKIIDTFKVF